jgi:hypothetical protein
MKRILLVSALALGAMTAVGTWLAPAAYAGNVKTCTTTTSTGHDHFTDTVVNTQTSACVSSSDTGFEPVSSTTKNKAGNAPGGFNK